MSEWVSTYPQLNTWLYFNSTDMIDGNTSLNSTGTHRTSKEYIDGSYEATMNFGIVMIKPYDNEQSTVNADAFAEAESFSEWIENVDYYPDFGEGFIVNDVHLIDKSPNIAVDSEQSLAKYTFFGVVEYTYNT